MYIGGFLSIGVIHFLWMFRHSFSDYHPFSELVHESVSLIGLPVIRIFSTSCSKITPFIFNCG